MSFVKLWNAFITNYNYKLSCKLNISCVTYQPLVWILFAITSWPIYLVTHIQPNNIEIASRPTKFVATETKISLKTKTSWTLTWYKAMRAQSTDQRPYTIKRSKKFLHDFSSSFATASAQHFDMVTNDREVLLVWSWWSMPRRRSLVLRISSNCRGTRLRTFEISVRYIATEARSSCI